MPRIVLTKLLSGAALLWLALPALGNGQLDPSFADGGRSLAVFATDESLPGAYTAPIKTLVQNDERVLVVCNTPTPLGSQFPGNTQIGVMRLRANGFPDPSYGFESKVLLDAGVDFEVNAVDALLLEDQSLIVLGTIFGPFDESDMALWKLRPNGQPDPAFGSNGFKRIRRGGSPQDVAGAMALLPNGDQVVIVGAIRDSAGQPRDVALMIVSLQTGAICGETFCGPVVGGDVGLPSQWRLHRHHVVHNGGPVDVQIEDFEAYFSPDGSGYRFRTLLNRSNANGAGDFDSLLVGTRLTSAVGVETDTDLGADGLRSFFFSAAPGYRHNHATAMAVQYQFQPPSPFGVPSLVIVGYVADASNTDPSIGVLRVDSNGGADASFNGGGSALVFDYATPFLHGDAYATDVLIDQVGGKILVGGVFEYLGFAAGDAALLRLNSDGSFDNSFGNLSGSLPGRMGYGHSILGTDRDNRLQSMALSADGEHLVFSGIGYASSSYQYGSIMKVRLFATELLRGGFE